jgi:hypothetical protein
MAVQYSKEEDEQWAESQRREEARRIGMGLPNRPGMGVPPRPRPQGIPSFGAPGPAPKGVGSPPGPARQSATRLPLPVRPPIDARAADAPDVRAGAGGVDIAEDATVGEAVNQGFVGGFAGGLSPASPLGAIAQIAEEMEEAEAERSANLAEHFDRFPELRGVEVPTGAAARFPELAEDDTQQSAQQPGQEGEYER